MNRLLKIYRKSYLPKYYEAYWLKIGREYFNACREYFDEETCYLILEYSFFSAFLGFKEKSLEQLLKEVCTPGGVTESIIKEYRKSKNIKKAIKEGIKRCATYENKQG